MEPAVREQQSNTLRGLATVAMLKANFDEGHDHIEMFQPFVRDCVDHVAREDFVVDDVKAAMMERHGLKIPYDTMQVLVGRLVKRKVLRREGGRFFRSGSEVLTPDLRGAREAAEHRQQALSAALLDYAAQKKLRLDRCEDALALILEFLRRYHVSLVLAEPVAVPEKVENEELAEPRHQMIVVAGFLRDVVARDDALTASLNEMLEGFVLQNAAFLKEIAEVRRRFRDVEVFLDTTLVLAATGLRGEAAEVAMKEGLALLKDTGARLAVFDVTLKEVRRILAVYEEHLTTTEGKMSLYPTEVTRFVLTKGYRPSDIREIGALLERRLLDICINVRELPVRKPEFTLDEDGLAQRLADRAGPQSRERGRSKFDPRVQHDVDCVAGVLQLRAGRTAISVDHSRAVFATGSWMTLRHATDWFEVQKVNDIPPIIHHLALSNLAWLKKPASAVKLQLHELVALCSAVLMPSRRLWEVFLKHLRALQDGGDITSEEVVAIVASSLTDNVLVEQDRDDRDFDARNVSEVIDRVRASYQEKANEQIAAAERKVQQSEGRAQSIQAKADSRASGIAKLVCVVATSFVVVLLIVGAVFTIPGVRTQPSPWDWIPTGVLALLGLLGIFSGFTLREFRGRIQAKLARAIRRWMVGE